MSNIPFLIFVGSNQYSSATAGKKNKKANELNNIIDLNLEWHTTVTIAICHLLPIATYETK